MSKPVLIFGCGNTLFGDDGFGPAVIAHLNDHYSLPSSVEACDIGTSIRDILFDLLISDHKPKLIIIIDAVHQGPDRTGRLMELSPHEIAQDKSNDFSVHQFPSLNLLRELDAVNGLAVHILAVKAGPLPEQVAPGLSPALQKAVPRACEWIMQQVSKCDD